MKTMMLSGAAIVAALTLGAAPAAAQAVAAPAPATQVQKADQNAVCLIAVTFIYMMGEKEGDKLPEDMKSQVQYFRNALHFHTGVLHARYTNEQLSPVMKAAVADYQAMPREKRAPFAVECVDEERSVLTVIADAIRG